jgi:3'-phosphoadenosine 5'-phosphosulfate sulfotransferase (PAPS reductase)/FAD synthetase
MGMGINSIAMLLDALDHNMDYTEACYVDHGTDWPETIAYLWFFQDWLKEHGHKQITVLYPDVEPTEKTEGFDKLIDYCEYKKIIPSMMFRWCTDKFKVQVLTKYYKKPCFNMLGIDWGERHRAKLNTYKGVENRFPLIESEMDRDDCKNLIERHGLPLPMKSGCYICPFQKNSDWKKLRRKHPDLFCRAEQLENRCNEVREANGKSRLYLRGKPLKVVVDEAQRHIFKDDDYSPCECML